jgi:hypothetical protein
VGGEVIRTTGEHPFYVERASGFLPVAELRIGDRLVGHDGQWAVVEDLLDTGEWERVYNLRVADWHTYFVAEAGWGFDVWAHNADYSSLQDGQRVGSAKKYTRAQKQKILAENISQNGGSLRSDISGELLVPPKKYQAGQTPPSNEAQIDHYFPRSEGGPNSFGNAQVLSRLENLAKSNSIPQPPG